MVNDMGHKPFGQGVPEDALNDATQVVVKGQALIDSFGDGHGLNWHHRILLHKGAGAWWVVATPDHAVEQADLSVHRVRPLRWGAAPPPDIVHEIYAFDPPEPDQLAQIRSDGAALARMLGYEVKAVGTVAGPTSRWLVADPGSEGFGEAVPDEVFQDLEESVVRETCALVLIDDPRACLYPKELGMFVFSKTCLKGAGHVCVFIKYF